MTLLKLTFLKKAWLVVLLSVTLLAYIAWHEFVVYRLSHYIDGLEAEIAAQLNWDEVVEVGTKLHGGQTMVLKPGLYNPISRSRSRLVTNCTIVSNTVVGTATISIE